MTFSRDFIRTHPTALTDVLPGVLLGLVVLASIGCGFLLGTVKTRADHQADRDLIVVPVSFVSQDSITVDVNEVAAESTATAATAVSAANAVTASTEVDESSGTEGNSAKEVGRLQAEILRLQVLFLRLAEMAGLDDGEFELDAEPLSSLAPSTPDTLKLVKQDLDHMSHQGLRMQRIYTERVARHESRISGTPIRNRAVSSRFGFRSDPDTGESRLHRGVDFSGAVGEPILAIASGVVTYASMNGGYGNLVELEHANGYRTRYAHNEKILVALGSVVAKGQQIATLGSTGRSTGPHLHFEVRQHGKAMDPQHFIR